MKHSKLRCCAAMVQCLFKRCCIKVLVQWTYDPYTVRADCIIIRNSRLKKPPYVRIDALVAVLNIIISSWLGKRKLVPAYMIYDMIWYDMIWYDMIYDKTWYMTWHDMIWYMIWYDMIWYDMIWYDMIWYDICFVNCSWFDTRYSVVLLR